MKNILPELKDDYSRWAAKIQEDPYRGQQYVGILDVLRAHYLIIDFFIREGVGIALIGPRNLNLLHSTLSRQISTFGGVTTRRSLKFLGKSQIGIVASGKQEIETNG